MCMYNVRYYTDVYINTYMFVEFIGSGDVCVFWAFLIIIMFDCCMCFKGISGIRFSLLPESSHRYRNPFIAAGTDLRPGRSDPPFHMRPAPG